MKKIKAILLSAVFCLSLSACGEEKVDFNETSAFEKAKPVLSENLKSDDYYIQISKTKAQAHVMTEVSSFEGNHAFMEYDISGAIKFFKDNTLTNISPETFYQVDTKEMAWEDFSYQKTADTYSAVLYTISQDTDAIKDITFEENDNEKYPFKVTVNYDLKKINANELFGSSGNFGSVSIKFLSDENGENFDEIALHVQYDYNSEIYVISAKYGDINLPDKKGKNGQRPEDIEKEYTQNAEELQSSFEQYLENMQASYNEAQ